MLDYTGRPFRVFMRGLTQRTLFYTEMITQHAILQGDAERHLRRDPMESPIALQLGGDDPRLLFQAARVAEPYNYDEINLNCGCPSERVQSGSFGAALMAHPERVAEAVFALSEATHRPVTVKHRIGIAPNDRFEDLLRFVDIVSKAPCARFIVHARSAILDKLTPKQNRQTPLRREEVFALKAARPDLCIEINGDIRDLDEAAALMTQVDAAMIGRAAYQNAYLFAQADARIFGDPSAAQKTRQQAFRDYLPYVERELARGTALSFLTKPLLSLYCGQPEAKRWRQATSTARSLCDLERLISFEEGT